MDFVPSARTIMRSAPLILIVSLLAGALAYGLSFIQPASYSSATQVLVRARDIRFLTSTGQDPSARAGLDLTQPKSLSQTLGGIATSRAVAEQVVRELKLDEQPAGTRSGLGHLLRTLPAYIQYGYYAEPDPFDAAVTQVQRSIEATPVRDSYLIEIKARASSPDRAAKIANAATQAFIEQTRQSFQRNASSYRVFLEGELERARQEVSTAEAAIATYKQEHGITDTAEASKLAAGSAESLRQQIREVETDLATARAKRASLQSTLAGLSPTERTTSSLTGPTLAQTPQPATASSSQESISPNRVYQDVQRSILALDGDIGGLQAKSDALKSSLDSLSKGAVALADDTAQLSQLDLQRSSAHATFSNIKAAYESAMLNEAQGAEEVRQIDLAQAPMYPDRPVRVLFLIMGLLFGAVLGLGLARVMDRSVARWTLAIPAPWRTPEAPRSAIAPNILVADDPPRPVSGAVRTTTRYEL
jgi:uncharacterized protein involved in exopolysaccharide biosynthesis